MIARHGLTASGGIASGNTPGETSTYNDQEGDWLGGLAVVVTGLVAIATTVVIATQVAGSAKKPRVDGPGDDAQAGTQDAEEGAEPGTTSVSAKDDLGNNIAGINVGPDVSFSAGIGVEIVADTAAKMPFLGSTSGTAI